MVVNMKVLLSLTLAVAVARAARPAGAGRPVGAGTGGKPEGAGPPPGVVPETALANAQGGPVAAEAAAAACDYPSCALDFGCPINFELTNANDKTFLQQFTTMDWESTVKLFVHCGVGDQPPPPSEGLAQELPHGVCVNGVWQWKDSAGSPIDRPTCLIESAACCLVRTYCPFDFTWLPGVPEVRDPGNGFVTWISTKDAESGVNIISLNTEIAFGGYYDEDNYATQCVDGTWTHEGEPLAAFIPDRIEIHYTSPECNYASCALDVGCPLYFGLTNANDKTFLNLHKNWNMERIVKLHVYCGVGDEPPPTSEYAFPRPQGVGECVDGAWVWKDQAGMNVDRPSCLVDSVDCCLVRTNCPYDFTWPPAIRDVSDAGTGFVTWINTKDAESGVNIISLNTELQFGGYYHDENYATQCTDGTWTHEGEPLEAFIPDRIDIDYTTAV